jgi:hypothetical protein
MMRPMVLVVLLIAALCGGARDAFAATITVNSGGDILADDGACTLREALLASAQLTATGGCPAGQGTDQIKLAVSTVTLAIAGAGENTGNAGDLDVKGVVEIDGAAGGTTIDGAQLDRVLDVVAGARLTLRDVTITGGRTPTGDNGSGTQSNGSNQLFGVAGEAGEDGGGIRAAGPLTLNRVIVTANATGNGGLGASAFSPAPSTAAFGGDGGNGGRGGGIATGAALTIVASTISHNTTGNGGSGNDGYGAANAGDLVGGAQGWGGPGGIGGDGAGIYATGAGTIADSTIADNDAGNGGPGANGHGGAGPSSTTSAAGADGGSGDGGPGGSGGHGGGLAVVGTITLTGSLIRNNTTGDGGPGGTGYAGSGGNGQTAGTGTGPGGNGGDAAGGSGGWGGEGGGVWTSRYAGGDIGPAVLAATSDTIVQNTTGAGRAGGNAYAGYGGLAAAGRRGGRGGDARPGSGGWGGPGGGAAESLLGSVDQKLLLTGATVVANTASSSAGAVGSAVAGGGGNGTPPGADGAQQSANAGSPGHGAGVAEAGVAGSIIANNTPDQCYNANAADGPQLGNVTWPGPGPGCGGTVGDPLLEALADNGGPTPTMRLGLTSAAIGVVAAGTASCPATDQRGVARPFGPACDAGAYERAAPGVAAGAAPDVTAAQTGATLHMAITPNQRATTVRFMWGATSAYGATTPNQTLAPSAAAVTAAAAVTGLEPGKTYHYVAVATNADGTTTGPDLTFTATAPPPPGSGAGGGAPGGGAGQPGGGTTTTPRPVLAALKLTPSAFRPVSGKHRKGRGTKLSWTDTLAATTTFTVQRRVTTRKKGRKTVVRWVTVAGSLNHTDKAGKNTMSWSGQLKKKALKAGTYRLRASATTKAGVRGPQVTKVFRVKR